MNSCNLSKEECKFSPNGINSEGTVEYKQNCVHSLQQQKSKYLFKSFHTRAHILTGRIGCKKKSLCWFKSFENLSLKRKRSGKSNVLWRYDF